MHGWRLWHMAPAQQGTGNIKHYWFVVNFKRWMFIRCHSKHIVFAWTKVSLSLFFPEFLLILWKKTRSPFSFFDRMSCVWWGRSRSIWSAGQATVACWPRTIQGSIHQSHASAQPMILNGNDFPSQISQLGLYCNSDFYPQWALISFITCLPNGSSPLNI